MEITEIDRQFGEFLSNQEAREHDQDAWLARVHEHARYTLRRWIDQMISELPQYIEDIMAKDDWLWAQKILTVITTYQKAESWAIEYEYDKYYKENYICLLYDYVKFLKKYKLYSDAKAVLRRLIPLAEETGGTIKSIIYTDFEDLLEN